MKKILFSLLAFASTVASAQDTLGIKYYQLGFDTQASHFYNDSLDFFYTPTRTGSSVAQENLTTRMRLSNDTGMVTNWGGAADVIEDTVVSVVDYSLETEINHRLILRAAAFKNGNNTVVIWPDSKDNPAYTKDSIKFNVHIAGYNSTGPQPLLEKVNIIDNSTGVSFQNKANQKVSLNIYELGGKLIEKVQLNPYQKETLDLSYGIYVAVLHEKNTMYVHKFLVQDFR